MSTEREQIGWQFAPDFYRSLNIKLDQATTLLVMDEFKPAFRLLKYVYLSIRSEILTSDKEKYVVMEKLHNEIVDAINEYEIMLIKFSEVSLVSRQMAINISTKKHIVDKKVSQFYSILHEQMIDLNMLFPKEVVDNRLPIYG